MSHIDTMKRKERRKEKNFFLWWELLEFILLRILYFDLSIIIYSIFLFFFFTIFYTMQCLSFYYVCCVLKFYLIIAIYIQSVNTFCPFIQFMRFSQQVCWSGLPFPPPVNHILSELSALTGLSGVALHGMSQ